MTELPDDSAATPVMAGDSPTDRATGRRPSGSTGRYVAGAHLAGLNSALALAMPQSPAFNVLAGLDRHPAPAAMDAVLTASQVAKTFDIPAITNWSEVLGNQFRSIDLMHAVGIGRQLTEALDSIVPQRAALNAALAGLSSHQSLLAAQLAQIVSSQDAISRVVLGADLVKSTALFDSLGRFGQVQASLGAFATTENTALLRGLTRAPARRYDSYLGGLPAKPIARRAPCHSCCCTADEWRAPPTPAEGNAAWTQQPMTECQTGGRPAGRSPTGRPRARPRTARSLGPLAEVLAN